MLASSPEERFLVLRRTNSTRPNPSASNPLLLGQEGERRAQQYLREKGYRIEGRNVRAGGVEIDLIARQRRIVVFIEVKTRRSRLFGSPEMAIDKKKRNRLAKGAHAWLAEYGKGFSEGRFDVIAWEVESMQGREDIWHCQHFEGAFDEND